MSEYRLVRIEELREGEGVAVDLGERRFAVFRSDGAFYALDETCPHRGGPLHAGRVDNGVVLCPWHQWQFELSTGASPLNPLSKVRCYRTRVDAGWVWVELAEEET